MNLLKLQFIKGYRTYLAIALTAVVFGLLQLGVIDKQLADWLVGLLSAAGLYFRSLATTTE